MAGQPRLRIVPCTIDRAKRITAEWHRHLRQPIESALWALAVEDEGGQVRGVAIVGRPKGPGYEGRRIAEVVRTATDGCPNACSALYGACSRAARALGYAALVTYTLADDEPGVSLRAAGWVDDGRIDRRKHRERNCASHPRRPSEAPGPKRRWWAPWSDLSRAIPVAWPEAADSGQARLL